MIQPLQIPNRLAGNPQREPTYKAQVSLQDGRKITVVDPRSTRALVALMDMGAVLGGAASHYGGPAALAELMSALHGLVFDEALTAKKPWFELFHLINDAGHCENGLYALKANYGMAGLELGSLKKFRSIDSKLTGHGESHLFPEGVLLSNGPLGSALPQSQGLAMADALANKARVTVTTISDGASMEGEAKESFAAIPGLAAAGKLAPFVMVITDNNTKLTGRIDADSFSMAPSFHSLETLGWKVVPCEKGNDLQACADAIATAIAAARANPKVPVAVHAKTIKGIGNKKAADSASGGHGFPLKSPAELPAFLAEIYSGGPEAEQFAPWIDELTRLEFELKAKSVKDTGEKIQKGISSAMIAARKAGLPVISVTSDLPGSTGVADFRKAFPEASLDVGVAESNMMSAAAGLSKSGYLPVVDTFAQFGVTKGALPLTMASLSDAPMIAVFSHTGFQDAADGASHQALSYLSMIGSIPHVEAYALTCSDEADALMTKALNRMAEDRKAGRSTNSVVFFLGRENFPKNFAPSATYELGQAQVLFDNSTTFLSAVTVVAAGSMVGQALEAAKILEQEGIGLIIINPALLNHADLKTLKPALTKTSGRLITVEDHQVLGGFGAMLVHSLVQNHIPVKVRSLGVHGEFGQSAYSAIELYRKHHMDAKAIASAARELISF